KYTRSLPRLRRAHIHVRINRVGSGGVDGCDAVGDQNGIAAHDVIAALKKNGCKSTVWAEVVCNSETRYQTIDLKYQIVACGRRNSAYPICAVGTITARTPIPEFGCTTSR